MHVHVRIYLKKKILRPTGNFLFYYQLERPKQCVQKRPKFAAEMCPNSPENWTGM